MKETLSYSSLLPQNKHRVMKRSLERDVTIRPSTRRSSPKRLGRGISAGQGKTCGRGHKGQKARSGYSYRKGFEGGQTPIYRRLPKRGFHNPFSKSYEILNLRDLQRIDSQQEINPQLLAEKGFITKSKNLIKILGQGEAPQGMKVIADAFSKNAREKLIAVGGSCEIRGALTESVEKQVLAGGSGGE